MMAILTGTTMAGEAQPPLIRQPIALGGDGCFRYTGNAVQFAGRFPAGRYVEVTMKTLGGDGLPVPAGEELRSPFMDAPEYRTPDAAYWFGPLPESRRYTIGFVPRAAFGSVVQVTVCSRETPPK